MNLNGDMAVIVWTLKCLYGCVHLIFYDEELSTLFVSKLLETKSKAFSPKPHSSPGDTMSKVTVSHIQVLVHEDCNRLYILGSTVEWTAMGQSRSAFNLKS